MPTMTYTLTNFFRTNFDYKAGETFTATATGTPVSNATLNSASLYFSAIKTWSTQLYFTMTLNGATGTTNSGYQSSTTIHAETFALSSFSQSLLTAGSGTIAFTVQKTGSWSTAIFNIRDTSTGTLTLNYTLNYSACGAPTAVSVNANNVAPGANVTLSWSGASAGNGNAITGYQVYRATSATGTYSLLTTVNTSATSGSATVAAPTASGSSYYYKVLTVGTVSGYNSGQSTAYATLTCLCTAASAPTSVTLNASLLNAGTGATLSWSGAAAGTNNAITGYTVYRATAAAGTYEQIGTATGTSFAVTASTTQGASFYYKVLTRGTVSGFDSGLSSAYASLKTNTAPAAPTISVPVSGKTCYNPQPRILATVGTDADGHTQTLTLSGYSPSSTGSLAAGRKVVFRRSAALTASGAQSVTLTAADPLGASGSATRSFSYAIPAYTDATLTAGTTPIRAAHINELRTQVNEVRAYYGLAAYAWAATVAAGVTSLAGWKNHVLELRNAIDQVVTLVNGWDTSSTTQNIALPAWIDIPTNKPTVAVVKQLRDAIPLL